ncbi:MAG: (2Fe-2S)-binding protein [Myxococcales bacterium]|nr:(2Fe-2S)-binding protein [Myxococcales bacterium]
MPIVTILRPEDAAPLVAEVHVGSTLFEAGAKVTAGIDTACVGKGTCGLCRVKIVAGAEHLNPFTDEERKHLGNVYHLTKVRLACRSKLTGDVTIQIVRKRK